jgi:hypothetical protein
MKQLIRINLFMEKHFIKYFCQYCYKIIIIDKISKIKTVTKNNKKIIKIIKKIK